MVTNMKNDYFEYANFLEHIGINDISILPDPKQILHRMYKFNLEMGVIRSNIDLDYIFNMGKDFREAGRHDLATNAYKSLISAITNNMARTNDPDEFYADCLVEAIEQMIGSVTQEKADAETMGIHITYMLTMCAKADSKMATYYSDALERMCGTPDSIRILEDKVNTRLRNASYASMYTALARLKTYILEETGRDDEMNRFLACSYHFDKDLAIKYIATLQGDDRQETRREILNAIEAFPENLEVAKAALSALNEQDPEYIQTASGLFARTGEWTYLDMVKDSAPDWLYQLDKIYDMIKSKPKLIIKMYIREKMYEKAMDVVEAADRLDIYYDFRPRLASKTQDRYFEAYSKKIFQFIASRTGREHYAKAKNHLLRIQKIPKSKDMFDYLLKRIRSRFSSRRTLLRAIHDL